MKNPEGVALAKQLIAKSDVVVENFSARVMASWGLDYPRMKEIRRISSWRACRHSARPARGATYVSFGPILMAYSGMTYLWRDPEIERPGAGCQTAFPDYIAPSYGALAILAALHYRARTGKGQYIDISQAETAASMIGPALFGILDQRPRARSHRVTSAPTPRRMAATAAKATIAGAPSRSRAKKSGYDSAKSPVIVNGLADARFADLAARRRQSQ